MKHKKGLFIALAVLVLALAGLISAKPLYNLYRDISFSWVERGEAEKTIKAFAEERGSPTENTPNLSSTCTKATRRPKILY